MKERDIQADLVRVVAMLFVIAVHVPLGKLGDNWWVNYFTRTLFFTCNAMFFMLSGKYNLRFNVEQGREKQSYFSYYRKKLIGIVIPFLIYSILLYLYEVRDVLFETGIVKLSNDFWYKFFCDNYNTHLWFMYSLIGLLLCAPFVARLLSTLSDFEVHLLVVMTLLWSVLKILLFKNVLDYPFNYSGWIFEGWILYFILGFCCEKIKKYVPIYICIGFGAMILTTLQRQFCERTHHIWDWSPLYTLVVLGVYLFLDRVCVVKRDFAKKLVSILAKYSFAVYIVHYAVKDYVVTEDVFTGMNQSLSPLLLYVARIGIVFVISFGLAFGVENLLVIPIKKCMGKLLHSR